MNEEISREEIAGRYRDLLESVDTWFARCIVTSGSHISCSRGCSECCRGLFDITLLDAWYLKTGFDRLPEAVREQVKGKAEQRVAGLNWLWPEFVPPFVLNVRPEEDWEELMPDEDETPCVLLDDSGQCILYEFRPMTCRLHGLPLVDVSGQVLHDEWCSLNFIGQDALRQSELREEFSRLFREEVLLFRLFVLNLLGRHVNELDTFIPAALMTDFTHFPWREWADAVTLIINDPV